MHVLVNSGARLGDAAAPHWYRTRLGVRHVLGSECVSARYTSSQVHFMPGTRHASAGCIELGVTACSDVSSAGYSSIRGCSTCWQQEMRRIPGLSEKRRIMIPGCVGRIIKVIYNVPVLGSAVRLEM